MLTVIEVRTPLIAGNWKMHGSESQVKSLIEGIKKGAPAYSNIDILVCPTFLHLIQVRHLLQGTKIALGAQNSYLGEQGAFTGEVSAKMLAEIGCEYVLIGHSERRSIFGENLSLIAQKFKSVVDAGLKPVLCVGETADERRIGRTEQVIREQLESVILFTGIGAFSDAVIAYEPVWAIGTGETATPEQAQETQHFIRKLIAQNNVDLANTIRILYGGSMKVENAAELLAMPDVDGGLIGGASLDADQFLAICAAASQEHIAAHNEMT